MQDKLKKVKLKGNESFNFREGWLRKGMRCIRKDPMLFSKEDVMEQLGVGSKMVKSIRFWLQATALCEEKYTNGGRNRALYITEDFGKIIEENDPYFDDLFTLFLIHYQIVSNRNFCVVWNIFFNDFEGADFSRENMIKVCSELFEKNIVKGLTYSKSLFEDDCSSVLRMYLPSSEKEEPEESLQCPLNNLGLMAKSSTQQNAFVKTSPSRDNFDKMAFFYVLRKNIPDGKNSVSIQELVDGANNVGRVFNLSRVRINEYLDQLRVAEYVIVNRTAGLDMVYLKENISAQEIMQRYYKSMQER